MVRIRLKRMGRRHRPFYRINAIDKRQQRDGRVLENLGWYDPIARDESKQVSLKVDRIKHWLSVGAQPSDTVADLLAKHDVIDPEKRAAQRRARVAGKIEKQEAERRAAEEKARADAEAQAKAAAEAAASAGGDAAAEEPGGDG
ncbi:MAG: 30S ribosomal protein S16 [Planctomycetota bacterium]|nr:MAG: 30S ribosomal protein S16 [Planctomycetota bacterium]